MLPAYIKIHDAIKKTSITVFGQLVVVCLVRETWQNIFLLAA